MTSKNQVTLPKAAVAAVGASEYFDVEVRQGQIVLTPVRIQRGDAVRAKLDALGLTQADAADAVRWARRGDAGQGVAEPQLAYVAREPQPTPAKKKSAKRK